MKSFFKRILILLGVIFLIVGTFLGIQSIRLNWLESPTITTLPELTPDQKAEDMAYLLDLTRQVSQVDAVWEVAGLENPLDAVDNWIDRARKTESNQAFADLVLQYLVHAGQGGHAYLAFDANFNLTISLVGNIPKDAFARMPLWGQEINQLPWYAHSNLDIVYSQGQYVLDQESVVGEITLPEGAVVIKVDDLDTDAFVLQQQYYAHLRYDPAESKFFLYPLLIIDPGRPGWNLTLRLQDGSAQTVFVNKIPGYVSFRQDENSAENIGCLTLTEDILYIRIRTFFYEYAASDGPILRDCFASGNFQKVIFDVRGNNGGEIWSYMENIIAPLIEEPVSYERIAAVKESFFRWYGWRLRLFKALNSNDLTDPHTHLQQVEQIALLPYSDEGWHVMRITRQIEPASNSFPFEGRAYVLTDNDTLSAGDSFAAAMQVTGLAKVVGANTVGWGQAYQAKMLYALPNSGILFYLDSELTFNSDGSLDNYIGVIPDVMLDASSYPTPYPASLDRESILSDTWVQWVLADPLE